MVALKLKNKKRIGVVHTISVDMTDMISIGLMGTIKRLPIENKSGIKNSLCYVYCFCPLTRFSYLTIMYLVLYYITCMSLKI